MKRILCALVLLAALALGQNPNTAIFPGGIATDSDLLVASNLVSTRLTAAIGTGDTTLSVEATASFIVPTTVTIGTEIIKCTAKTASSFTGCTRGFDSGAGGTAAAAHANNSAVTANVVAWYFNQVAAEVKAIEAAALLNPMTTLGDTIYGGAAGAPTALAGNTTATRKFLTQIGNGTVSAAPAWNTIAAGDVPTLNQNTTGNAATATALAANPVDCSANQFANAIAANGDLTCAQVAYTQVSGTPTLYNQTVQDEGVDLTQRSKLNFIGTTITCADNSMTGVTDCTLSGTGAHNLLSATHSDTVTHTAVLGDIVYANSTPAWQALAGNTTTTKKYLSQTGNGSVSAAPAWAQIAAADLSNGTTGSGGGIVLATSPTLSSPVITNIAPGADFTLTQNSVAVMTSVNTSAAVNTLYLNAGQVGIGVTSIPFVSTAGRRYLSLKGTSLGSFVEIQSAQADADANVIGGMQMVDINASGEGRIAAVIANLSGSTANNRGGQLRFLTKANNGALSDVMQISNTGAVRLLGYGAGTLVTDSSGNVTASASGGASITQGTYASLPATCTTNDLYYQTDGPYSFRCSATNTWTAFLGGFGKVTVPPSSGWTWDNQGSSTSDTTFGSLYLRMLGAGSTAFRAYLRNVPAATPYKVTFFMRIDNLDLGGSSTDSSNSGCGLAFEDGGGKMLNWYIGNTSGSSKWTLEKWTNTTTFSAAYSSRTDEYIDQWKYPVHSGIWLRLQDDGTNLKWDWSLDGQTWHTSESHARGDFLSTAPTKYGPVCRVGTTTGTIQVISLTES